MMAHRLMVFGGGVKMYGLGANQSEMEFLGALEWSVEDVPRAFRVICTITVIAAKAGIQRGRATGRRT